MRAQAEKPRWARLRRSLARRLRLVEWWGTNCPPARRTFAVMNTGENRVVAGGELQAAAERKENIAIS